jgi:NitT/TauT family transport system ATP-binding protein
MNNGDVLVRVDDVSLRLGGTPILAHVDFSIVDRVRPGTTTGQVVALLGPSGVGKTRLLRIIAGLDAPDSGRVLDDAGKILEGGSVGVVFQDYPLIRHRTVEGNLHLAGKVAGINPGDIAKRTKELLDAFRLADRAHLYPSQLSGGQKQRVAIAQQIMRPRRLLLLDEPFSGLDPAALKKVMTLIVEVANLDDLNTIVIVTHDIRAALAVSDTVFVLGRDTSAEGTPSGARVRSTYDLVEMGLAWREDVQDTPEFVRVEREIRSAFKTL